MPPLYGAKRSTATRAWGGGDTATRNGLPRLSSQPRRRTGAVTQVAQAKGRHTLKLPGLDSLARFQAALGRFDSPAASVPSAIGFASPSFGRRAIGGACSTARCVRR